MGKFFEHAVSRSGGAMDADNLSQLVRVFHKVAEPSAMTVEFSINEGAVVRRLRVGELVEVVEGPVKEETVGPMRVKCIALKDGNSGWVTSVGNQGTQYLQERGNVLKASTTDAILEGGGCAKAPSEAEDVPVVRKLKKAELLEVLEWEKGKEDSDVAFKVRCRARSDGCVGWVLKSKLAAT